MLFWILLFLCCFGLILPVVGIVLAFAARSQARDNADYIGFCCAFGAMLVIFPGLFVCAVWDSHADDLGTIAAQQEVISVYEKQRDDLNKTLASFKYPSGSTADSAAQFSVNVNVNADSPVRSIVEQLANVESLLASARSDRAEAIKSIEQRRAGPASGVIRFAGDYK